LSGFEVVYTNVSIVACVFVVLALGLSIRELAFPESRLIDGAAIRFSRGAH